MSGRKTVFLMATIVVTLSFSARGQMPRPEDIDVVNGVCNSGSHIAEGLIGEDLTKRQSRFYCDTAAITFFQDYRGHVLVQFAEKASHHGQSIGFSGRLDPDGIMMQVERIYFSGDTPTTVSDGACKFFFKDRHMVGIFCGAKIDETGRRTSAIVGFDLAPGQ